MFGGPRTPAIGWAAGVERILLAIESDGEELPHDVFVAADEGHREQALALVTELRRAGLRADLDLASRSMKGQMRQADRTGAARTVILEGDDVRIRDMGSGEQREVDAGSGGRGAHLRMSATEPGFPALRPNDYRDAWCGQVLPARVGETVRVAGWVHRRRDHGGLIFIDLRDRTGLVQLVFNPDTAGGAFELGHKLRSEDVLTASGEVVRRSEETINRDLPTGEVEVRVADSTLLADADTPPFEIESFSGEVGEEARLRYRYLDLRRDRMRGAIELRHRVVRAIREFFDGEGFVDIETPMLSRSTPEGARDFLVPSRREPGSFYALPQSPQLFKQLLMVAGFERYYQVVRCFRDEDQRADRQLDFTQLDVEMSFVDTEDVIDVNERCWPT